MAQERHPTLRRRSNNVRGGLSARLIKQGSIAPRRAIRLIAIAS
jgi:hypothetical protein